ncbi:MULTISPECIES: hypothetical protein [Syntrophotalea]|jgi:hypothetical protein|uniref:Uncharacterized protein n=1 Tax=Syntrophotalea acetylenica TaxID=29542 RepID=A0A1L3GCY7_SYNAC|nr:hypothetical protein [Syntrophotalea acetylenica]APG23777.1 hypothetical protein A7E75_01130 [Syntrophotalea acetylenica]APG44358.1 hypothetical protein A6070_09740 [Syntrophotalea acetylenica]
MSPLLIVLILAALLGLAGVGVAVTLALRLRRLERQLHRETPAAEPCSAFQAPLLQAALSERLHRNPFHRAVPDRYKLAADLLGQGMTAQQIADLLGLPPAEVRQLVNLSKINRSRPDAAKAPKEMAPFGR